MKINENHIAHIIEKEKRKEKSKQKRFIYKINITFATQKRGKMPE